MNPTLAVCIPWSGFDLTGRKVCMDSWYTKREGCNSAADRVIVENNLRPQYFEYINLSAAGVRSDMYNNNMHYTDAGVLEQQRDISENYTGNFGGMPSYPGTNQATCSYGRYTEGQLQEMGQKEMNQERQAGMRPGTNQPPPGSREGYRPSARGGPPKKVGFPTRKFPEASRRNAALTNGFRNSRFRTDSGMK